MKRLDNYRELITEISHARKIKDALAEQLIERICILLKNDFDIIDVISENNNRLNKIENHLALLSESALDKANIFYKDIPDEQGLRDYLIQNYHDTENAVKNDDFPKACRCIFKQLEALISFIFYKYNLFEYLRQESEKAEKYYFKIRDGRNEISLNNKILLINDYFNEFFKRHPESNGRELKKSYSYSHFNKCYNARNYDSHGIFGDEASESKRIIEEIKHQYKIILSHPYTVIKMLRDRVVVFDSTLVFNNKK